MEISSKEPYSPSQSETVVHAFALELRETNLLSFLQSSIEIFGSSTEVSESFLRCTFGTLVHPRELSLFQAVQKFMLFHGVCETVIPLIVLVQFNPLFKTPVVGETCDSCMLEKGGPLGVVGGEFILVGFVDQHKSQKVVLTGT